MGQRTPFRQTRGGQARPGRHRQAPVQFRDVVRLFRHAGGCFKLATGTAAFETRIVMSEPKSTQPEAKSTVNIPIKGKDYTVSIRHLQHDTLKFYPENPRIYSVLHDGGGKVPIPRRNPGVPSGHGPRKRVEGRHKGKRRPHRAPVCERSHAGGRRRQQPPRSLSHARRGKRRPMGNGKMRHPAERGRRQRHRLTSGAVPSEGQKRLAPLRTSILPPPPPLQR